MKLTSHEEYGLRCLLRIGREGSLTIPEISRAEGMSTPYVAKLLRMLRQSGFVKSTRGKIGGYALARPAEQIVIGEVLGALGGRLFEGDFCTEHTGEMTICTHSVDCSIRSLWRAVQTVVDQLLSRTTLKDLLCNEPEMVVWVSNVAKQPAVKIKTPHPVQITG